MNYEVGTTEAPRVMAARIAKLKTRDERRAALEKVPAVYRDLVQTHVTNSLLLAWHWRDRINADQFAPVPDCVRHLLETLEI